MNHLQERVERTLSFLRNRKRDYCFTFRNNRGGSAVLADLAKFCRANESTFHSDPRVHAVLEGRREVWLRIQQHLNLTPDELFALYTGHESQLQAQPDGDEE